MSVFSLLETSPTFLVVLVFLFGLLVGSFLNVVIYRLPVMMERAWQQEARSVLSLPDAPVERQQHKKQRSEKKGKRNTFSRKDPDKDLPTCRFEPGEHKRTWLKTTDNQKNRAWCEWCKYEAAVAKQDGNPLPRKTPVKTTKFCTYCSPNYRLCPDHFDIWHEQS